MEGVKLKLSVKLSLGVLAVYLAAAIYGEVQYHAARAKDVTASYNEVNLSARYLPPIPTFAFYLDLPQDGMGIDGKERNGQHDDACH